MNWYVEYTFSTVYVSNILFYLGHKQKSEVGFNLLRSKFITHELGLTLVIL